MPIFILSILIQVALVLHIVKTGRNTTWIWIVVMLPIAGSIAYFVVEVLPDITGSKTGRKAGRKIQDIVNPHKDIKSAAHNYSMSSNVENSMRLAGELLKKNMYVEARDLYKQCLKGVHQYDPYIMYGVAEAEYGLHNFSQAKEILDELIRHNPDYKNADAHLLYAKSAEALGDTELALSEYEILHGYYPGPEAAYRYARLCHELGEQEKAKTLLNEIITKAKYSGGHYNSIHKEWIKQARIKLDRI